MNSFGTDTVGYLQRAAVLRRADADCLFNHRRYGGALYLLGYVVECYVKAAFFRVMRFHTVDVIEDDDRRMFEKQARLLGLMSNQPHDIAGWARFLVYKRDEQARPLGHELATNLVEQVTRVYDCWRPSIRYRGFNSYEDVVVATECCDWLRTIYINLY